MWGHITSADSHRGPGKKSKVPFDPFLRLQLVLSQRPPYMVCMFVRYCIKQQVKGVAGTLARSTSCGGQRRVLERTATRGGRCALQDVYAVLHHTFQLNLKITLRVR